MPENVGPVRWFNKIVGTCLVIIAGVTAILPGIAVYFDGVSSIFDWPALFTWLSALALLFFGAGVYLLATPQRIGGWVTFRDDGFIIEIRNFVSKDVYLDADWSDVEKIKISKAARQPDGVTITLTRGAQVSFQTGYFEFDADTILARLSASAQAANYRLERTGGFNAILVETQTWHVLPAS